MPTLAQDLAAAGSNFQDNREFHDYIYSKLLLSDDKSASQVLLRPLVQIVPISFVQGTVRCSPVLC